MNTAYLTAENAENTKMRKTPSIHEEQVRDLAAYLMGFGEASNNDKMINAANRLKQLASIGICSQNIAGCRGGNDCSSDHK